mmetsp:Transcript_2055/g.4928  ORF Transcript_2055/g.4928 Transcript_2055/m.4928 type:complete len:282 (+) Transcript_2055:346-1191(+)
MYRSRGTSSCIFLLVDAINVDTSDVKGGISIVLLGFTDESNGCMAQSIGDLEGRRVGVVPLAQLVKVSFAKTEIKNIQPRISMVGRILQPEAFVPDHHFGVVPETDLDHRGSLEINIGGNVRRPAVFFHLELCREDVLVQVLFYHIATAVEDPKVFPEVFLQKFLRLFLEGIRIEIAINLLLRRGGRRVKGGGTRRRQSSYRRTGRRSHWTGSRGRRGGRQLCWHRNGHGYGNGSGNSDRGSGSNFVAHRSLTARGIRTRIVVDGYNRLVEGPSAFHKFHH